MDARTEIANRWTLLTRAVGHDLARYAISSAISLATILSVSALLHELAGFASWLAVAIALTTALAVNFAVLRAFVFAGQTLGRGRQFLETAATSISFRGVEYALFLILNMTLGIGYLGATTAAVFTSALGKFVVYRQVVFDRGRGSKDDTQASLGRRAAQSPAPSRSAPEGATPPRRSDRSPPPAT